MFFISNFAFIKFYVLTNFTHLHLIKYTNLFDCVTFALLSGIQKTTTTTTKIKKTFLFICKNIVCVYEFNKNFLLIYLIRVFLI